MNSAATTNRQRRSAWPAAVAFLIAGVCPCAGEEPLSNPALLTPPAVESGPEFADPREELSARLEALERRNAELRRRLGLPDENGAPAQSGLPEDPAEESAGAGADAPGAAGDHAADEQAEEWYEIGSDFKLSPKWNNGLVFTNDDEDFRVHVGGRVQFNGIWWADSEAFRGTGGAGDEDGVSFRRARLRVDGTMFEWIDWASDFDFANSVNVNVGQQAASPDNVVSVVAPTDLWVNFKHIPVVGNVRIGNSKEPIGMEHANSSNYLPFLERSFNQDVFYGQFNNGFTPGVLLWNTYADQRGVWATGLYKGTNNAFAFNSGDGDYAWTSRVTYLLWYDECSNGRSLFHIGASNSLRDPETGFVRYRARPSLRNGPSALNPVFADTGRLPADTVDYVGLESAMNYGPFTMQAEWTGGFIDGVTGNGLAGSSAVSNAFIQGAYVHALYFLTGEHMLYDRQAGAFARVVPNENAYVLKGLRGTVFGKGAWQLGVRYSYMDLNSAPLNGGVLNDWTFGVNWYLNPSVKVQGNYVVTQRDARLNEGLINGFGMRLAFDF